MAARNTHFKTVYTQAEREDCFQWFEEHMEQLPPQLLSIPSMRIHDLPATVKRMIQVLKKHMPDTTTYNGQFALLLFIRQKVMEEMEKNT